MKKFVKFEFSIYGRSQGLQWVQMHPHGGENKLGVIYRVVSAPPGRVCTPMQSKSLIFNEIVDICTAGVVNLVVLACVLRATTKKGCQLFRGRKVHPTENPGYAYVTS